MPQFMIQAKDYTDEQALQRRMSVRETHLARMREEKKKDIFIIGGALLKSDNQMIGSIIILSLSDEESVWHWIKQDIYMTGRVWQEVQVLPFRIAEV